MVIFSFPESLKVRVGNEKKTHFEIKNIFQKVRKNFEEKNLTS